MLKVLIVHFAYNVIALVTAVEKVYDDVKPASEYQPAKVYPVFVGSVGWVAVLL